MLLSSRRVRAEELMVICVGMGRVLIPWTAEVRSGRVVTIPRLVLLRREESQRGRSVVSVGEVRIVASKVL